MVRILTWLTSTQDGAVQKQGELGIFSDALTTKPDLSFDFTNLMYIEQSNTFTVDGKTMTEHQKVEVIEYLDDYVIPVEWYVNAKMYALFNDYTSAQTVLIGSADFAEIASWNKQEAEARAFIDNSKALTPILDTLISARNLGEDKEAFAKSIVSKADKYDIEYAKVLGAYKAKVKQLKLATTLDEIIAV